MVRPALSRVNITMIWGFIPEIDFVNSGQPRDNDLGEKMRTNSRRLRTLIAIGVGFSIVFVGSPAEASALRTAKASVSTASYVATKFRADRRVSPSEYQSGCLKNAAATWAKKSVQYNRWTTSPTTSAARTCKMLTVTSVRITTKASSASIVTSFRKTTTYKRMVKSTTYRFFGTGAYYDSKTKMKRVVLLIARARPVTAPVVVVPTEPIPTEPIPTEPIPTEPIPTEPVYVDPVRSMTIEDGIKTELVTQMGEPWNAGDTFEVTPGTPCIEDAVQKWGLDTASDQNKTKTFVPLSFFNNTSCISDYGEGMVIRSDKDNAHDIVNEWLTRPTVIGGYGFGAMAPFYSAMFNGSGDIAVRTYVDFRGKTWTYLIAGWGNTNVRMSNHQIEVMKDEMHRLLNVYRVENALPEMVRTPCLDNFAEGARELAGSYRNSSGFWAIAAFAHRNRPAPCPIGNDAEVLTEMAINNYEPTDEYAIAMAGRAMWNWKNSAPHNRALLIADGTDNGVAVYNSDISGIVYAVMEPSN